MRYIVGNNLPGCLPDDTDGLSTFDTFREARQALINELLSRADTTRTCASDTGAEHCADGCACDLDNAAQDVNLWSAPQAITVGSRNYWVEVAES